VVIGQQAGGNREKEDVPERERGAELGLFEAGAEGPLFLQPREQTTIERQGVREEGELFGPA